MRLSAIAVAFVVACLLSPARAAPPDAKVLLDQANAAYEAKDYAASAARFVQAIAAGDQSSGTAYDAACTHALIGDTESAFRYFELAIASGYSHPDSAETDADLASLHGDPRWAPLLARLRALHPEAAYFKLLSEPSKPAAARYFPVHRALREGLQLQARGSLLYSDLYAPVASMVGDYDEARERYRRPVKAAEDAVAQGYDHASPANAVILDKARDRQAVFLNESHGEAQTRAATYTLLAPLRKLGFQYLALEALTAPSPERDAVTGCAAPALADAGLPQRGYPTLKTGYYTAEPVYAEILREALRLGFTLVAYDGGGNRAPREQYQAEAIACLFRSDPKARVLVIGGFGHISERKDDVYPGGVMGYRFKTLTGIDPLTVNSSALLSLDPDKLQFAKGDRKRGAHSYVLRNARDQLFGSDAYDLMVYVPGPAHRNDAGGSWLELDGARKKTPVKAARCLGKFPCLVEAHAAGESAEAIASDRCVIESASQTGCTLFLRPGKYMVAVSDENQVRLGSAPQTVR